MVIYKMSRVFVKNTLYPTAKSFIVLLWLEQLTILLWSFFYTGLEAGDDINGQRFVFQSMVERPLCILMIAIGVEDEVNDEVNISLFW